MGFVIYNGTDVADFAAYQTVYKYIQAGNVYLDTGWGWYYICLFFGKLGLSYAAVKTILFFISALLIKYTIDSYVKNKYSKAMIWSLFLIFPALLDGIQIRFFVAEGIVLFAMPWLTTERKTDRIKYAVLVLMAMSVHSSAAFYLLFLFAPLTKYVKREILAITIFASGILYLGKQSILRFAARFINANRIERYFMSSDGVGLFGVIAYTTTIVVFIILMRKAAFWASENNVEIRIKKFFALAEQLSVLALLILPLTTFDTNFFRIQRPFWLILYLEGAVMLENGERTLELMGKKIRAKSIYTIVAVMANLTFICAFSFNVIKDFLM